MANEGANPMMSNLQVFTEITVDSEAIRDAPEMSRFRKLRDVLRIDYCVVPVRKICSGCEAMTRYRANCRAF